MRYRKQIYGYQGVSGRGGAVNWKTAIVIYTLLLLLLLLSRFSRIQLCATPETAAHQAPPGSPPGSAIPGILQARTLVWVAISFSNAWEVKSESEVSESCLTLCDPMDCSPPGSSVHGIFQARVLEWVAIYYILKSEKWK